MLNSFPISLLAGTILGLLSGLGIGGGSLLMLWLTLVLEIPYPVARRVNLLFFIPAAVITCIFRRSSGILRIKPLLPAIISGTVAAASVSWATAGTDTALLKKAFGILLFLTGLREICYKQKKEEP